MCFISNSCWELMICMMILKLLQSDISSLCLWYHTNDLELNLKKCFRVSFGRSLNRIPNIYNVDNISVKSVLTINELSDLFHSKLTFHHILLIKKIKVWETLLLSREIVFTLLSQTSLYLSCSFCAEYALVVWCPFYACHISNLEVVQKSFLRTFGSSANINIYNKFHINYNLIDQHFIKYWMVYITALPFYTVLVLIINIEADTLCCFFTFPFITPIMVFILCMFACCEYLLGTVWSIYW